MDSKEVDEQILTVSEASKLLRLSESSVYALVGKRELPACKVGREWRFIKSQLLDWLKARSAAQVEGLGAQLLEMLDEGVAVLDEDLRIVSCNGSYCGMCGLEQAQVIGRFCYQVSHKADVPCPESICPVRKAFRTKKPAKDSHIHYDAEGKEHQVDVLAFPMQSRTRRGPQVIEIFRDNTEMYELNKHLSWVVEFVAHELNGTLSSVVMNVSALTEEQDTGSISENQRTEMLDAALSGLKIMHDMIRNYLTTAKVKKGQLEFNRTTVDLIKDVLEPALASLEPVLRKKRMAVVTKSPEHRLAYCDKNLVRIVLNNLINNAIKYGAEGTQVYCTFSEVDNELEFSVLNEGIGIPPDKIEEVFNEYARFDPLGIGGTGLGLYVVKKIVEMHGGTITAGSGYMIRGEAVSYADLATKRAFYDIEHGAEKELPRFAKLTVRIPKGIPR